MANIAGVTFPGKPPAWATPFDLDAGSASDLLGVGGRRMVLIVKNSSTSATNTATLTSQTDKDGRTKALAIEMDGGEEAVVVLPDYPWLDSSRKITAALSNVSVKLLNTP